MRVDVIPTYQSVSEQNLRGRTVVVIDVLRATTVMITALHSGALRIVPVDDPGSAALMASSLDRKDVVLAGESEGIRVNGFDLGNSPLEFTRDHVKGKMVITSTSNGTKAFLKVTAGAQVYLGAMINRRAVAKAAFEAKNDITLLCAGTDGAFSCDDVCCAGAICAALAEWDDGSIVWNDLARNAQLVYRSWKDGTFSLENTTHYSRLMKLGFKGDLDFCFREDVTDLVPHFENGVITV